MMKLQSIQTVCFTLSVLLCIPQIRAEARQKDEGRLEKATRVAQVALKDRGTRVFTTVAAVAAVAIIYAHRAQLESPESNQIAISASPQIKNQYPQTGMLVLDDFSQSSDSVSFYLQDFQERGVLQPLEEGNTYQVDAWQVLDDVAVCRAKFGPLSKLANDLEGVLAPLKKDA